MFLGVNFEHKYNSGLTEFPLCGQEQRKRLQMKTCICMLALEQRQQYNCIASIYLFSKKAKQSEHQTNIWILC